MEINTDQPEQPLIQPPLSRHVVNVQRQSSEYHVLRLSPGPSAPATTYDIILPPHLAFTPAEVSTPEYPVFVATSCGWQVLLTLVIQPQYLWDSWGPSSLGEYNDISSLWKCWDEGAVIEGVGQKPPLRMVEAEWGARKDRRSNKGHLAVWRARQSANVSLFIRFCSIFLVICL